MIHQVNCCEDFNFKGSDYWTNYFDHSSIAATGTLCLSSIEPLSEFELICFAYIINKSELLWGAWKANGWVFIAHNDH